ncbi:MAG: hypothetical protein A3I73_00845 [Omnitrophica bacterium RIFCSPLOWO2_02_FULL_45_16]|nr:MAG: hypothetical protein A3C51_04270 [Omnitrophica bacterium RIFCSPHIGHO2_02_FULL_46_20]OGX00753.1 MAG: hypothetical protein A3I73_00845 [Omnitrophica bacterium RIFCSPLOWO2_02_FULL_45_16]
MAKIQALYSRCSTDMQRDKGFSVPRQKKWLEDEAKHRKFSNIRHYPDDGYSAKDYNRPSFKRLLSDIENDAIDVVMVYKGDRIARNTVGFLEFVDLCNKHTIEIISLSEKFDTTTPTGRLTLTILASLAEWEREQTADRVSDAMWAKAEKGDFCGGQPPYGYDIKDKCLIINPTESAIIKLIYDSFEDDPFFRGVTRKLNALGYRTKRGTTFAQSTVKRLLTNVVYIGKQSYGKRAGGSKTIRKDASVFQARHEAIITEEQFNRVRYLIKNKPHERRDRKYPVDYILSELVRCECGGSIVTYTQPKKTKDGVKLYPYYVCHNYQSKGTCKRKKIPKAYLEQQVLEQVRKEAKLKFEEQEAKDIPKKNPQEHLKRVENTIRGIKAHRVRLIDALAEGSLPRDLVVSKMDRFTLELEDAENQRQILIAENDPKEKQERGAVLERVNKLNGDIFSLSDIDKKAIMRQIIKSIVVSKTGEIEIDLYEL